MNGHKPLGRAGESPPRELQPRQTRHVAEHLVDHIEVSDARVLGAGVDNCEREAADVGTVEGAADVDDVVLVRRCEVDVGGEAAAVSEAALAQARAAFEDDVGAVEDAFAMKQVQ